MSVLDSARLRKFLIGAAIIAALMLTVPHFVATSSGAYKLAMATAHQKAQFTQTVGPPITEAWFSEGKEVWSNPATAEMLIPVRGQIRTGNLRVRAIKDAGKWRLTELTLELTSPDEHIDLLVKTPISLKARVLSERPGFANRDRMQ